MGAGANLQPSLCLQEFAGPGLARVQGNGLQVCRKPRKACSTTGPALGTVNLWMCQPGINCAWANTVDQGHVRSGRAGTRSWADCCTKRKAACRQARSEYSRQVRLRRALQGLGCEISQDWQRRALSPHGVDPRCRGRQAWRPAARRRHNKSLDVPSRDWLCPGLMLTIGSLEEWQWQMRTRGLSWQEARAKDCGSA